MSICVGKVIRNADAIVVAIPMLAFILMLPGLLYFELAFDIQKSMLFEILLCLLPSCGAALVLRHVCAAEALNLGITWGYVTAVSGTPIYAYILVLCLDVFIYSGIAFLLSSGAPNRATGRDSDPALKIALQVSNLRKNYNNKNDGKSVSVLSDINCSLEFDTVTLLLGSNGAGKTTLMKILCGLDSSYGGSIIFSHKEDASARLIGWCPQTEALFSCLTVLEHMELFLHLQTKKMFDDDSFSVSQFCTWLLRGKTQDSFVTTTSLLSLSKLNMLEHKDKRVEALSGGMKRRVSLSLACIGDPKVLLLDEPTSGCDAWTRELVRKDILSRRRGTAILVSTHHTDDIDVLANHVWFLNDRYLSFSGKVSELKRINSRSVAERNLQSSDSDLSSEITGSGDEDDAFEFSTWDAAVAESFRACFKSLSSVESEEKPSMTCWIVPARYRLELIKFVSTLEAQGNNNWSLTSLQIFKALCNMYDSVEGEANTSRSFPVLNSQNSKRFQSYFKSVIDFRRHVRAIVNIRFIEQKKKIKNFLLLQLLFPFLVVFLLVLGCGDVDYPKVELTSRNINGVGEVCLAKNDKASKRSSTIAVTSDVSRILRELDGLDNQITFTSKRLGNLAENGSFADYFQDQVFGSENYISWQGDMNSDALWKHLYEEYDRHVGHRWGAFVMDDSMPHWIETTIVINELSLHMDIYTVFEQIQRAALKLCNVKATQSRRPNLADTKNSFVNQIKKISICPTYPSITISMYNGTFPDINTSFANSSGTNHLANSDVMISLIVSSFEALNTNLTLLSNVTTDHAAPIFLRELFPLMYRHIGTNYLEEQSNVSNISPQYKLFSHPFFQANLTNFNFMQRGYLGSTIILLYMLLTTIVSVRFITKARSSGFKRQMHLTGVHPIAYWVGNYLSDVALVLSALLSVHAAINIGGEPIRSYFFQYDSFSGSVFLLMIVELSFAVVASSYFLSVLSSDQLSSQLFMLVSTVSSGVFLKLYLDRYEYFPFTAISSFFLWTAPSYTFATVMFFMFQRYETVVTAVAVAEGAVQSSSHNLSSIFAYSPIMILQSVVYLFLTISIDMYWTKLVALFLRFRWYFSIHECFSNNNKVGKEINVTSISATTSAENTALLSTNGGSAHSYSEENFESKGNGHRLLSILRMHGDVGFFPILENADLQILRRSVSFQGKVAVSEDSSSDIEMIDMRRTLDTHQPLLEADRLFVEYGNSGNLSLCDLSFSFDRGERIALMGMNGGGKTTLFNTLALSECIPIAGFAAVAGENLFELLRWLSLPQTNSVCKQDCTQFVTFGN